ncbi:MAG: family peptidase [Gemmatimonadetes bacterium]|jgi:zinc protease|nr:family peptidase [Gemmatimonadota bacterium]
MDMMRFSALAALSMALTAAPIAAQQTATKTTSVEGITEYHLPNGLRVLLFPDQSKPTVTVNVTYMVGSRHEGYGETGMAHLLEHLQFKGTATRHDIPVEMDKHGARWNASTWLDRTNYFETMTSSAENLTWALGLEADRMTHSLIAEKDRSSEMTVVRNEFEAGENDPFSILLERTVSTAYLWHNYGHSTIGARSDIENVPIERLQAFYHKYYQPDNAVLLVAGKFNEAATLKQIARLFGTMSKPVRSVAHGNILYPTYTQEPTQDGERSVTLRRVGDVQVVTAVYHVPALSHPDFASIDVLANVLGREPSGRLYQSLVVPKLASSTGAFDFQLREPSTLVAFAQVRKEASLDKAREVLLQSIDSVRTRPPTVAEVERAKASLLKDIDLLLNNSDQVGLALSEWQAAGDWRLLFVHRDRLKRVTPADVQRAAVNYLKPSNVTVGLFYPTSKPDRAEIPGAVDIAAVVRDYKGDSALGVGEAFDAAPANIDVRTSVTSLANGMRVSLLQKKTRGAAVKGRLILRFGSEQSLQGQRGARELASAMLERGTKSLTRQQLQDSLDLLRASVRVRGGVDRATITIETVRSSVPAVLSLVADMSSQPRFDSAEFEQLKQERIAGLEQDLSDPQALAGNAFDRRIDPRAPEHPLYTPTIDEHIKSITGTTLGETRAFHDRFYGAGAADLVLVGDFDSTAVRAAATKLFSGWKSKEQWARIPVPYRAIDSSTTVIETPDKANALFLAGQNLPIRDDSPDYPALLMGDYIVGGGALDSRLANRIRQKEGISYGVGSFMSARATDSSGVWETYAIYAPENASRLAHAFDEEIARALKSGVTAEELSKAKNGWLQEYAQQRSNDDELASQIATHREVNRTFKYDADLERRVQSVTISQVNAALKKYLIPASFTKVRAGDFAKAKAKVSVQ